MLCRSDDVPNQPAKGVSGAGRTVASRDRWARSNQGYRAAGALSSATIRLTARCHQRGSHVAVKGARWPAIENHPSNDGQCFSYTAWQTACSSCAIGSYYIPVLEPPRTRSNSGEHRGLPLQQCLWAMAERFLMTAQHRMSPERWDILVLLSLLWGGSFFFVRDGEPSLMSGEEASPLPLELGPVDQDVEPDQLMPPLYYRNQARPQPVGTFWQAWAVPHARQNHPNAAWFQPDFGVPRRPILQFSWASVA